MWPEVRNPGLLEPNRLDRKLRLAEVALILKKEGKEAPPERFEIPVHVRPRDRIRGGKIW